MTYQNQSGTKIQQIAIASPNKKSRDSAIDKMAAKRDVVGLIRVLGSKYSDAVERAEMNLNSYNFK
ncbi:MAG: hypothetical protein ABID61_01045 [Candidatus Micrarchaeota archaeon]